MKKLFKILGVVVVIVVLGIAAIPWLFSDQIIQLLKDKLNASLTAQVDFQELDISLIQSFPKAQLTLSNLTIINDGVFKGDTLLMAQDVLVDVPFKDIFNKPKESLHISNIVINRADLYLQVSKDGVSNWDIVKQDANSIPGEITNEESTGYEFNIKSYGLNDSQITYDDQQSGTFFQFNNLNHSGSGDFSASSSDINTHTDGLVSLSTGGITYFEEQSISLDAILTMDFEKSIYYFKSNELFINDLVLTMHGTATLDEDIELDLKFNTQQSDFKNLLALIPLQYKSYLNGIQTTGDCTITGSVVGGITDDEIPQFNIIIDAVNGTLKYEQLPERLSNISFKTSLRNITGDVDDTYLEIEKASFTCANQTFTGNATLKKLNTNPTVFLSASGVVNFEKLSQALPIESLQNAAGVLALDVQSNFDLQSLQSQRYEQVFTKGSAQLTNFHFENEQLTKPLDIGVAALDLNRNRVKLTDFTASLGATDIMATGRIDNLMGYLFQDQVLKGTFDVKSQLFDTNDFMTKTEANENVKPTAITQEPTIQIPSFLDIELDFNVNQVRYDNVELEEVSGTAIIRDQTILLNDVQAILFDGFIALDGAVSTPDQDIPRFDMALDLRKVDLAKSFKGLEMMQRLTPVLAALQGRITTQINLNGALTDQFTPDLTSIVGTAFAQVNSKSLQVSNTPLITQLNNELSFVDLEGLSLSDFSTRLNFDKGAVQVAPFDVILKDIAVNVSGSHSLMNEMNYALEIHVPADYLGNDALSVLSSLSQSERAKLKMDIPVLVTGSITQPQIKIDLKKSISNVSKRILEAQKEKIKQQAKETLNDAVNGVLSGNNPIKNVADQAKDLLNKPSQQDTDTTAVRNDTITKQTKKNPIENQAREAANKLLNGLFKKGS